MDGKHVPQSTLPRFVVPGKGAKLTFEVASFVVAEPLPHRSFLSLCENLAQQSSTHQRRLFLECLVQDGPTSQKQREPSNKSQSATFSSGIVDSSLIICPSAVWLSSDQVGTMLRTEHDPLLRWEMLKVVGCRVVDPVNLLLGVFDLLTMRIHKRRLLLWISRDVDRLEEDKAHPNKAHAAPILPHEHRSETNKRTTTRSRK